MLAQGTPARAETGYDLWLRYTAGGRRGPARRLSPARRPRSSCRTGSPTGEVIAAELTRGLTGLLGVDRAARRSPDAAGAVVVGTPSTSPLVAALGWDGDARARSATRATSFARRPSAACPRPSIASTGETGALYGAFHFLRLMQTRQPIARARHRRAAAARAAAAESLGQSRRQHRARLRRPVAVAGRIASRRPRIADYARANASIGINGTRHQQRQRQSAVADRAATSRRSAAIARVFRPYGIRVYLSANFAAPKHDRRPDDQRSARPGRRALVAREGRRDLPAHSRLRRLRRQGQQRRTARAAGLRPHARRRRQRARRRRRAARRHRHVARLRLQRRGRSRSRQARLRGVRAARRDVPRQRLRPGEERRRSTSSRASRSIRCSARCRRRR